MKTIMIALLSLSAIPALAAQPSIYNCSSEDGVRLNYTTSSFRGEPTLSIFINGRNVVAGPELLVSFQHDNTMLGTLVTVSVLNRHIADAPTRVYAFLIPGIELGRANRAQFKTALIEGWNGGFRAPDPIVYQGINKSHALNCSASYALF